MLLTCPSPAKINLFLHIIGRRADGYHLLQGIMQLLDFGDTLHFESRNDNQIIVTPELPNTPPEDNLIYRAARQLQMQCPDRGVSIHCEKKIPMGAGLGGGSSNCATTLIALNQLWQCGNTPIALARMGLALGADVPFFIYGKTSFAEGVGEVLTPLNLPESWYVLVIPPIHVATQEIFSAKELTRDTPALKIRALPTEARNDCEAVVFKRYAAVKAAYDWLNRFGPARMTGSGCAVFVPVASQDAAMEITKQSPWQAIIAKGVNHSPLCQGWCA